MCIIFTCSASAGQQPIIVVVVVVVLVLVLVLGKSPKSPLRRQFEAIVHEIRFIGNQQLMGVIKITL